MKRSGLCIALIWLIGVPCGAELPTVFETFLENRNRVENYVIECETRTNERAMISDEHGQNISLDSFLEYSYRTRMAFDRGKMMYDATVPLIRNGEIVPGQTTREQLAYDGTRMIARRIDGLVYEISAPDKTHWEFLSPLNLFDGSIDFLPRTKEKIEEGKTTFREVVEGDLHAVEFSHDTGFKTTWTFNTAKGFGIESIRLYYPSESLCHEREVTEWKKFSPDVWLPVKAFYAGYRENGERNRLHEYEIVEAEVNAPEVDPSLFTLQIPAGARVSHTDLGIVTELEETLSDAAPFVGEVMLEQAEARLAKAKQDSPEHAKPDPSAESEAAQSYVAPTQSRPGHFWAWGLAMLIVAAAGTAAMARKRPKKKV